MAENQQTPEASRERGTGAGGCSDHLENERRINLEPVREEFPVISDDLEIRVVGIIMEALRRHLLPSNCECVPDIAMAPARRVVRYIASRIGA